MLNWDKDERPASLYTRMYMVGMKVARDKRAFEGARHTLRTARRLQREGNAPPTRWTRMATRVATKRVAEMTVWTVAPRRRKPVARVVYIHGGGYVHPLTVDYWRLIRALATVPAEVIVPAYPLAPDATLDDVLPRLQQVEAEAAQAEPRLPTVLMGDSAGGALVIAMALRMRDLGASRPAGVVALSPWLDATLGDEEVRDLETTDPILAESGLRAAGRWWSGARGPTDPLVSPVHSNMEDLPPLDVYIGDRDILRPAVDALAERAQGERVDLYVHEVTAMFHVWMTRAIPEGRRTRRQLARLVLRRATRVAPTRPHSPSVPSATKRGGTRSS
jgi:monoterpene epsilon-lactone hydrolase